MTEAGRLPKVFISYSRDVADFVRDLARALEREGVEVRYDEKLSLGDPWELRLRDWLETCDALLSVVSRQSSESKFVAAELEAAITDGKRIIPILVDDMKPRGVLASIRWCDLRSVAESRDFESAPDWKLLLYTLRSLQTGPAVPSSDAGLSRPVVTVFHHSDDKALADGLIELLAASSLVALRAVSYSGARLRWAELFGPSSAVLLIVATPRLLRERDLIREVTVRATRTAVPTRTFVVSYGASDKELAELNGLQVVDGLFKRATRQLFEYLVSAGVRGSPPPPRAIDAYLERARALAFPSLPMSHPRLLDGVEPESPKPTESDDAMPVEARATLAFRLVVAGASPDLLLSFEPMALLEHAERFVKGASGSPNALLSVAELLAAQQPGVAPNALWLAWACNTQRHLVERFRPFK